MIELSDKNFEKTMENNNKIIIDFWAGWCPPCVRFKPVFKKMEKEYDGIFFGTVDVDDYPGLAGKFNIMSIPQIIFFKKGEEVRRIKGYRSEQDFRAEIEKFLE